MATAERLERRIQPLPSSIFSTIQERAAWLWILQAQGSCIWACRKWGELETFERSPVGRFSLGKELLRKGNDAL